jgi:hypothetical protein
MYARVKYVDANQLPTIICIKYIIIKLYSITGDHHSVYIQLSLKNGMFLRWQVKEK